MDVGKSMESENLYARALFIMGWLVIVLGIIGSFILGNTYLTYDYEFNFAVFLVGAISSAMSGFLILGLAEIIRILHDNRKVLNAISQNSFGSKAAGSSNASTVVEELPEI